MNTEDSFNHTLTKEKLQELLTREGLKELSVSSDSPRALRQLEKLFFLIKQKEDKILLSDWYYYLIKLLLIQDEHDLALEKLNDLEFMVITYNLRASEAQKRFLQSKALWQKAVGHHSFMENTLKELHELESLLES